MFGARIRELRRTKRLTQRALADQLDIAFSYISKIETGHMDVLPSEDLIRRMAVALDADPDELLDLAGKFNPDVLREAVEQLPELGPVLRRIQPGQLTAQQAAAMMNIVSRAGAS